MTAEYDGIVVCGGASRRLGGVSKPSIDFGGRRLLDIAIAALAGASRVVAVGPPVGVTGVTCVRETPAGGGPVAALAAGLACATAPLVAVLAADLPFVTAATVEQLVAAAPAVAVDDDGRDQPLLAVYERAALLAALPDEPANARLRSVTSVMAVRRVTLAGSPPPWFDCDTPAQLAEARRMQAGVA